MGEDRRLVPGQHPEADMVDVAPFRSRAGAAHAAELPLHRNEVDQRSAGSQLVEADLRLDLLDGRSEHVGIKAQGGLEIADAKDDMVDRGQPDHAASSAFTPGKSLPSIHS